jgi:hypothetical protein
MVPSPLPIIGLLPAEETQVDFALCELSALPKEGAPSTKPI